MRRPRKPLYRLSVPGVRIPPSPLSSAPVIVAGAEQSVSEPFQVGNAMKFFQSYWFPFAFTIAAMAYAYQLDARDGGIAWPLLLTGTIIAGAGFFGGSYLIRKHSSKHEHR